MLKEIFSGSIIRALLTEFLGTFLLVFFSLGTGLPFPSALPSVLQAAVAAGLIVATLGQSLGHIGGAHLNPAVTLAFFCSSHVSLLQVGAYCIVQVLGGLCGAALLYVLTSPDVRGNLALNSMRNNVTPYQAAVGELFFTFQLVLCILASTDSRRTDNLGCPAISIGLSASLGNLLGIYFTGCSMNPVRSLCPAILVGDFTLQWVFWVGPLAGGTLASFIYHFILTPSEKSCSNKHHESSERESCAQGKGNISAMVPSSRRLGEASFLLELMLSPSSWATYGGKDRSKGSSIITPSSTSQITIQHVCMSGAEKVLNDLGKTLHESDSAATTIEAPNVLAS